MSLHVALIGCGKMGSAMAQGWLVQGHIAKLTLIDPYSGEDLTNIPSKTSCSYSQTAADSDIANAELVILAVKPQIMSEICASIKDIINSNATIMSIAAGKSIKSFEDIFGSDRPIIRVMPNTPAAVGKGMSVMVANNHVSTDVKEQALALLQVSGKAEIIDDENLMNAVTAVSGSGPAYIFLLIEAMSNAGIKAGLPEDIAQTLARQTVIGSAYLAEDMADIPAATLRENVTSPGGTTQAALDILMAENGLKDLMDKAIMAAKKRGEELGS